MGHLPLVVFAVAAAAVAVAEVPVGYSRNSVESYGTL